MELNNKLQKQESVSREVYEILLVLLAPIAPHFTEEVWERIGHSDFIITQSWPEYNPMYLQAQSCTVAVQVNGKVRGSYEFMNGVTQEEVIETVYEKEEIKKWIEGKDIMKEVYIPGKILNVVVK